MASGTTLCSTTGCCNSNSHRLWQPLLAAGLALSRAKAQIQALYKYISAAPGTAPQSAAPQRQHSSRQHSGDSTAPAQRRADLGRAVGVGEAVAEVDKVEGAQAQQARHHGAAKAQDALPHSRACAWAQFCGKSGATQVPLGDEADTGVASGLHPSKTKKYIFNFEGRVFRGPPLAARPPWPVAALSVQASGGHPPRATGWPPTHSNPGSISCGGGCGGAPQYKARVVPTPQQSPLLSPTHLRGAWFTHMRGACSAPYPPYPPAARRWPAQ